MKTCLDCNKTGTKGFCQLSDGYRCVTCHARRYWAEKSKGQDCVKCQRAGAQRYYMAKDGNGLICANCYEAEMRPKRMKDKLCVDCGKKGAGRYLRFSDQNEDRC